MAQRRPPAPGARGRGPNRNPTTVPSRRRSPSPEHFDFPPDDTASSSEQGSNKEIVPPPALQSPIKRRQRKAAPGINQQSDLEVWQLSDEEIIAAARTSWRSDAYNHYTVSLRREVDSEGQPLSLSFVFTCKSRPDKHPLLTRPRSKTAEGTSNLVKGMNMCLEAQGIRQKLDGEPPVPYTSAGHRALLAQRCAANARPFNMVSDPDYVKEVQMLRPGTTVPSPNTVSRDLNQIYLDMSSHVRNYFMSLNSAIHLVLDGWTSPIVSSYLGLVVVWYEQGLIHRAILEFVRLKQKHDGRYLAQVVADCLNRFGLARLLFSLCMDNASNCDALAQILPSYIPTFWGEDARLRCLAHIVNLIAKIFISFFFKKPKRKKSIKVSAGAKTKNGGFRRPGEATDFSDGDEIILDEGDGTDDENEDIAVVEEADAEEDEVEDDEGQTAHNEQVVKTLREKAIYQMAQKGIEIVPEEERVALQIFPKVAGLARRVHDNGVLKEKFDKLVAADDELKGQRRALTRRVPTRWNYDLECLDAHFYFRDIIEQFTAVSSNGLQAYRLSPEQWEIASDVQEVLLLFNDITKIFSVAETPLIVDVLPTLENLREGLIAARDDEVNNPSNVVRVGCHAAVLLVDKYSAFSGACDINIIATVMCPDRKLKWFEDHGRNKNQLKGIETMIGDYWVDRYAGEEQNEVVEEQGKGKARRSRYAPEAREVQYVKDHINTYLKEPLVPSETIQEMGGYMMYWHNARETRPRLSRMGSDFCSAPATSVDAERAFSTGHRQINFTQHNISSQTFKAEMALGSWIKSPLYPGLKEVTQMVEKRMDSDFFTS